MTSSTLCSRARLGLAVSTLLFVTTLKAQVVVPLTDSSISFSGNAHYNASLCGGAIYLPDIGDSITWSFTGSDFEVDGILDGHPDERNITVLPEDNSIYTGLPRTSSDSSTNCRQTILLNERWSDPFQKQLILGRHTVIIQNSGDVTDKGNGVVIGGLQYYPDSIADLPTYTAVSQRSKPMKNHTGAIIGGVVGGVVFLAAIIVAGIFLYKPELRKRFISKKPGDTRKDLLGEDSPSMAGASGSSIGIAGEEQRIEAGQPRMVERSHS